MSIELASAYVSLSASTEKIPGQIKQAVGDGGKQAEAAAKSSGAGIGGKMAGAMKGPLVAGVAAAAGAAVAKMGVEMLSGIQEANRAIRVGTGATGAAFEALKADARSVTKEVPESYATVAATLADLNTLTGKTGGELQGLTKTFMDMSRITGSDVSTNITSVTRAFGDWNIAAEDQQKTMDYLFKAYQTTGTGIDTLAQKAVQFGAPLRNMGYSFEQTIAMFGKWQKEGVNAELVMGGLRIASGKLAKAGLDIPTGVSAAIKAIKEAGTTSEAAAIAVQTFGQRAGADLVDSIRNGKLDIDELTQSLINSDETIQKATDDTRTFSESWQMLKDKALMAAQPALEKTIDFFSSIGSWIGDKVVPAIKDFWRSFEESGKAAAISEKFQEIWGKVKELWVDLGPILSDVWTVLKPVLGVIAAAAWEHFKATLEGISRALDVAKVVFGHVRQQIDNTKQAVDTIGGAFGKAGDFIGAVVDKVKSLIEWLGKIKIPEGLKSFAGGVGDFVGGLFRANGGPISGPGGPTSDLIPTMLSNGEHVLTAREVLAMGGHQGVYRMRAAARAGGLAFAEGGAVDINRWWEKPEKAEKPKKGPKAPKEKGPQYGGQPKGIKDALKAGKAKSGSIYDFGGGGESGRGWDCSGWVAWLQQIAMGQTPKGRLYSTLAFLGGGDVAGLKSGIGPSGTLFKVGIFDNGTGGKNGHMAATIAGQPAESGGSHGTSRIGAPAVGAEHSSFNIKYHLPNESIAGFVGGSVYDDASGNYGEKGPAPQAGAIDRTYGAKDKEWLALEKAWVSANEKRNEVYADAEATELDRMEADIALIEAEAARAKGVGADSKGTLKGALSDYAHTMLDIGIDSVRSEFLPFGLDKVWGKADDVLGIAAGSEHLNPKRVSKDDIFSQLGFIPEDDGIPEWVLKMRENQPKVFDTGGWLKPGEMGINLSSKPEPIFNSPGQLAKFAGQIAPGMSGGGLTREDVEAMIATRPNITVQAVNVDEAVRKISTEQRRYAMTYNRR